MRGTRRVASALASAPPSIRAIAIVLILAAVWLSVNVVYQVMRKPAELWFPVSGALSKMPADTWRQYGPLFRYYSTPTMTPDLLAALAQVEGAGNPVAHTPWAWRLSWNPLAWYRPASSAVGMYQITDGTFDEARDFCIHDHAVATRTTWDDPHGCWFNALYTRIVPADAIQMTSAFLDREVEGVLVREHVTGATLRHRQNLAAVIHLCGPGGGEIYAHRGFATAGQVCGDERVASYLSAVVLYQRQFLALAAASR